MKEESSNSWFICVNKILRKYDLKEAYSYLDNPIKKSRWLSLVKLTVNDHWCTQLTTLAQLYKGLQYLSNHNLSKCKIHPILKHRCYSSLDISRIPVKLRPVTGTYVLQTKRIKYYRNESDPTCLLCGAAEENVLHFILQCEKLQLERVALLSEINAIWQNEFQNIENFDQLQLLIDNTIKVKPTNKSSAIIARLEGLSRRLMFKLHIKRTKLLESDRDKIQTTMKKRI